MDTQKLLLHLPDPVSDQPRYGSSGGSSIAYQRVKKDKAAENELKTATIKCTNQGCPWQGPGRFYMVSIFNK